MKKVRLGIFISGAGSNAKLIAQTFENHPSIEVSAIVSNNFSTPLLQDNAVKHLVECFTSQEMTQSSDFVKLCAAKFDYIILAGYLKLIPTDLITAFPNRIINIHPALLPNYGGKGMYGGNVHKAVFENKEELSGITIHFVNEQYDKGQFIAQLYTDITSCESPEQIAKRVQKLEHAYYPKVIETIILNAE